MGKTEKQAECRRCRMKLIGKPYYMGGFAYHPRTREQCKVNYFGGFVCSPECDYQASIDQLSSMPGAGEARRLDSHAQASFDRNWK
jgi:hypothetical protein